MGCNNGKQLVDACEKEWKMLVMDAVKTKRKYEVVLPVVGDSYYVHFGAIHDDSYFYPYRICGRITKGISQDTNTMNLMHHMNGKLSNLVACYTECGRENIFHKYLDVNEFVNVNGDKLIQMHCSGDCATLKQIANSVLHYARQNYIEYNMKRLLLASIMEYLCDANNYKNNKTINNIERALADEYVVRCISKY